jgi:hypothetical protein
MASAQYALAQLYASGKHLPNGTQADVRKASQWLRLASDRGHIEAKWALAQLLMTAQTGISDGSRKYSIRASADALTLQAASGGIVPAMLEAAKIYRHGHGSISPNATTALEWFQLAAEKVNVVMSPLRNPLHICLNLLQSNFLTKMQCMIFLSRQYCTSHSRKYPSYLACIPGADTDRVRREMPRHKWK